LGKRGESFQKRAREKARQEKQAEKRERRESSESESGDDDLTRAEEDKLMQSFAALSAKHEAGDVSTEKYEEERHRIFVELGLESDE
jgi:hypothetical protein